MRVPELSGLLVLDIETAPCYPSFEQMPERWQDLWKQKIGRNLPGEESPGSLYAARAGVMAEFSRILCISTGYFYSEPQVCLRIRSFNDADERSLLTGFTDYLSLLRKHQKGLVFAGHNIREFDVPFLCRRLLANRLSIPGCLDFQHMKPWEVNLVDTFQYWRFGDYKQFTSLNLLAAVLDLPSPKEDMDGSMVASLYWSSTGVEEQKKAVNSITGYCERDVITTANILLRLSGRPILHPDDITKTG